MTASRRLRNSGVKVRSIAAVSSPSRRSRPKPMADFACSGGPRVGGHDQHHVAEVHRAAVVVGQLAVVHHLQQDVVDIRVRLLDLVEQQHAMRVLVHAIGQQATLVEADVARRRADQARDRVFLHVLGHVEAQQFHAERIRQLLRHLGLADARGAGKEVVADGLLGFAQTSPRQLDRRAEGVDRGVLAEDHAFQAAFEVLEDLGIVLRDVLRRDAGDLGHHGLDFLHADGLPTLRFSHQDAAQRQPRRSRRWPCRAACGR